MNKFNTIRAASIAAVMGMAGAVIALAPAVAAEPAATPPATTMHHHHHHRHGMMSHKHVTGVQQALNNSGAKLAVDGKWGPKTEAALKQFQQQHGLKATGHLDRETRTQLKI
jgi:peptidoglycan hydrolase-like protein with peptidoglycan-binding domain